MQAVHDLIMNISRRALIHDLGEPLRIEILHDQAHDAQNLPLPRGELWRIALKKGEDIFFAATGITDGELMDGVRFTERCMTSQSLVMRAKSHTIRTITSEHPHRY